MKVVLFCGGLGTRLREFSETIPKPMVNIGNRPIIWHLMKYYAHYGHKDFVLCLGYGGATIREFFLKYDECMSNDFTLSRGGKEIKVFGNDIADWTITFVDTGIRSNIAQRLLAVRAHLQNDEVFLANYSDGLSDLPLDRHINTLLKSDAVAAFVSVRPAQSFSGIEADSAGYVTKIEYLNLSDIRINGGFFVLRKEIFDYIQPGDELVEQPFQRLIQERRLITTTYDGFWAAMDTFKDKKRFDEMVDSGDTPWSVWVGANGRSQRIP